MASNNSPFTLNSRGSVKGMIFSSAFGKDYFKTRPETISNPRTPGQTSQRLALALVTSTWQGIETFGNVAYKKRAIGMSPYNQFAKQNLSQSKMTINLSANTASWNPGAIEVKPNPSQQGVFTGLIGAGDATFSVVSLPISRPFILYFIGQGSDGVVGAPYKTTATSTASGTIGITVASSDLGLPDFSLCAISIVDTVTGEVSNGIAIL